MDSIARKIMFKYPYEVPEVALRDLANSPAGSILVTRRWSETGGRFT
jgi:hypothetical protein